MRKGTHGNGALVQARRSECLGYMGQRKRRGQNQKQKPERFRRTRSLLAQRAGEKRGEKMLRCGGILCVWTPNTMIMQMEKQKGRQSPFAKEKQESSLRYVKFEVHRLPNRTRSLRYYYVRLNHGGGNKARELETTVNSLIPLICILVNLASRRMSELRPSAEVSWCPTSIRGTKPTHLFFSRSTSCGLGSLRTQGIDAPAVACTERILQSLGQKTKYFLFICSNSLALTTK